ncbi:MAG TPA: ABC transporter substrate-binding protein [Paenirhodobacter sp.]
MTKTLFPALSRRRLLQTSVLAFAVAPFLSAPVVAQAAGATLRIAFYRDNTNLVSLDPFQVYWLEHRVVLRNVVESLTDQDQTSGAIIPWLAQSWQISADGLAYTFHLRQGVTFSDGTPFDAAAVKTAFDSNYAFVKAVPATFGRTYLEGYDHAEVVDPQTVRLVLTKRNAGFLQATSTTNLAILAPASYAKTADERARGALIGTGPFTLDSYTPEVGLTLRRREDYAWPSAAMANRGRAHLAAIEVRYVPEASVRNGQFLQGAFDIIWPRDPFSDLDIAFLTSGGGQIVSRALPGPSLNLFPNTAVGRPLADPAIRAALQKAIDRETYAKGVFSADFPAVQGPYDTTTPYFKPQGDKLGYDPKGAATILDQAGWRRGTDGWRVKDGQRLTLIRPVQTAETAGDVLLQDQLRQVGIELVLNVLVTGDYYAAVKAGNYDLASSYMSRADPAVLQTFLDPRYTNRSALAVNTYPADVLPRAQALFDAGLAAPSDDERRAAYGRLQDLLIDENIAFPIYERLWQAALAPRVQGFNWTAEGFAILSDIQIAEA